MSEREPIILLAHGSPDPRHATGIAALATRVAAAGEAAVHVAYLDHHGPTPADAAQAAGRGVVVPALLSLGYLAVQTSQGYVPPTWPNEPGRQQMQLHLDIEVDNLDEAVGAAVALGATQAAYQPQHDVRVLLDPAGHPFCLYCPGWPVPRA